MRKFLFFLLPLPFLFFFAFAVVLPSGVFVGDVVIGKPDPDSFSGLSMIQTAALDPPDGASGYPYTYYRGYQYYSSSSGTTFLSSTSFDDGYASFPVSGQTNFCSRLFDPDNNITFNPNTAFYYWIDMYVYLSDGTPLAASLLNNLSFAISNRNVRSSLNITYGASVSLAASDILSYDSSTGHLSGYVLFENGVPVTCKVLAGSSASDSNLFIGVIGGGSYQYKLSNVVFAAEPSDFIPPGLDPDDPTLSFEDQVLQDLEDIKNNQQSQTEQITDAIQDQTSQIDNNFSSAVDPDIDTNISNVKDSVSQIEQFESSLFDDLSQYESDVDPSDFTFDPGIVSALSFVSNLWVNCFDQLGIWKPIITFPMFFGLALLVIGRGFQAQVSTRTRVQRAEYLKSLRAENDRRAV